MSTNVSEELQHPSSVQEFTIDIMNGGSNLGNVKIKKTAVLILFVE
jgi:hypothetical protein